MTDGGESIEKLRRAYRVLGLLETASAMAIKANYRKLIKRWHPDKPQTAAATAAEAAQMTKLINEAYSLIENAPLRYYTGTKPAAAEPTKAQPTAKTTPTTATAPKYRAREKRGLEGISDDEAARIEKRVEYAVRIGCGLISGAFVGLILAEDLLKNDVEAFVSAVACAAIFAAGAVKVGDKAWREIFGIWWKWD